MITHRSAVAGESVVIHVAESASDLDRFADFVAANRCLLGVDSETTGLDIYSDNFRLRLVQFGTATQAWVIPVEQGPVFAAAAKHALETVYRCVLHNASFDLQIFDKCLGVRLEALWPKTLDTYILSHLVDPRANHEGGTGHRLEDLTHHYLDPGVAKGVKTLMTRLAREYKTTKSRIWTLIESTNPQYQLYAGMDPVLTIRLMRVLIPLVPDISRPLIDVEHRIAAVCSQMERTGFLVDVDYTSKLSEQLRQEEQLWSARAKQWGCGNPFAPQQVADALEAQGCVITQRTPTGKRKVDKELLEHVVAQSRSPLATAILHARKARKWRTTWIDTFLATRDSADRCHASIHSLKARTARMSITGIPTQTLPSTDWMVRRCFLADEGHVIASVDYQAQELRVLAALSGDQTMTRAFRDNANLHLLTARAAFGSHITKDHTTEYKAAKKTNFGRVYGGGATVVAAQTGISVQRAQSIVDTFDRTYPSVRRYSRYLQHQALRTGYVITPAGRRLPVDPARAYSALNYMVQSTSRDVTCRALLRLHEAGFTPYLRLPIHDEILASLPAETATEQAREIGRLMTEHMGAVTINTDPEVGGRSWGSLYTHGDHGVTDPYLLVSPTPLTEKVPS